MLHGLIYALVGGLFFWLQGRMRQPRPARLRSDGSYELRFSPIVSGIGLAALVIFGTTAMWTAYLRVAGWAWMELMWIVFAAGGAVILVEGRTLFVVDEESITRERIAGTARRVLWSDVSELRWDLRRRELRVRDQRSRLSFPSSLDGREVLAQTILRHVDPEVINRAPLIRAALWDLARQR